MKPYNPIMTPPTHQCLVLVAHPDLARSKSTRHVVNALTKLPFCTLHDLYQHYPEHIIDIKIEQNLLKHHHGVIALHPLYWYSAPSILKEWFDTVLTPNFAYGERFELAGKWWQQIITMGDHEHAYQVGHRHDVGMSQLLSPFELTMRTCKINYRKPFIIDNTDELNEPQILQRATQYIQQLEKMIDHEYMPPRDG